MERITAFDRYHYLAQEVHNLPLFETIPRINTILGAATNHNPERQAILDDLMGRYNTAMTQAISMVLSRNIEQDATTMIANWIRFKGDMSDMFKAVFDIPKLRELFEYPFNTSPVAFVGVAVMPVVKEFWACVTAIQFMLPIIAGAQKRYLEVYNQNLSFSNMICIVDQFMQELYPSGWELICHSIYKRAVTLPVGSEEILGQVILVGLSKLELDPNKYINMCDIEAVLDMVISAHEAFKPKVLPPTNMY